MTGRRYSPPGPEKEREAVVRDKLDRLRQQITTAETDVRAVEEQAQSQAIVWERPAGILDETRYLASAWDRMDLVERRILLDMWVLDEYSLDLSQRHYRPENVVLIVAGDFDFAEAERSIRWHYAAWEPGCVAPEIPP